MDKYLVLTECTGSRDITDLTDEVDMNYLSILFTRDNINVTCENLENGSLNYSDKEIINMMYEQCLLDEESDTYRHKLYKYTDVLSSKKELFGSNVTLSKNTFRVCFTNEYYYSIKNDGIVTLQFPGGGDCGSEYSNKVMSAKVINENLIIIASITFEYSCQADPSCAEYTNYNKYEYTFKKENGNYYLAEIKKLNN